MSYRIFHEMAVGRVEDADAFEVLACADERSHLAAAINGMLEVFQPGAEAAQVFTGGLEGLEAFQDMTVTAWDFTVAQKEQNIADDLAGLPVRTDERKGNGFHVAGVGNNFTDTPLHMD